MARRDSIGLSRKRIVQDLEAAKNPRYRKVLENALAHLDAELAALESKKA